ncbi:MAG: hypothetical protein LBR83_04115 [Clostridiales bacterium]|jgi:hypothetical protein|nr:hypothetical protein [Clostridiales bacterium]
MSVETRHTEKNILFQLLKAADAGDLQEIIFNLCATMEPEDVELVKKQFEDYKRSKGN